MELLRPLNDAVYAGKSVAYTGTAGTTAAMPSGAQGVVVWTTTAAYVRVGPSGSTTATTADTPLPANTPVPFFVPTTANTGQPFVVSAIQVAAGGTVYAKPINIR